MQRYCNSVVFLYHLQLFAYFCTRVKSMETNGCWNMGCICFTWAQTCKLTDINRTSDLPACFPGPPPAAGAPPSGDGAIRPSPVGGGSCQRSPPRTPERESFSGSRTSTAADLPCHRLQQRQYSMNIKILFGSFFFLSWFSSYFQLWL